MVIDRSKHNKFVGLPEKTTDTGGTTGASGSSSGDGSTTVIIGGGGGTANLDPELIEELRNQEAFSYINISDGQNSILTSAQIEKDYFNLAIQGDGETSETQVSSDKYLPRTQIEATGSIPGSYWVVFNHVQVPDEGPDGEPVYKDVWRIELTKMSPDPAVRPNIDYNGIELIYQGVSQGVYSLSDDRVSVQSTDSEDTLTITINQDSYIDFDTLQLVWTQDTNHTPVTTLPGIAIQNYVTVTITQAGATRFWKLDEYGNLYTDYTAYSNLNLGAKGQLWTDTGLYVGNFTQGISGGVFYVQNEQGDTYIEADRMRVRKKAYFETLEIVNVNSVGGKQIISPAGAVTLRKVEETTITDADGTETPVYRCYFMGEQDGVEVENRWHVGDQAFSQNFNIRTPGEYEQVANHYFWRLVVGLSTELDDDGNYYIDLSVTDCDTDSDIPHANDVVAQLGNRTDVDRQSALIFSSVDAESPRIILCHGIDSYTLSNTEYFDVGVNHAENRAYMNVYGDTYIGDRNNIDESRGYIYYDSSTQTLNIRASISASSTIGDKSFSEVFVTAEDYNNFTNTITSSIEGIQNQIDGTIEAYFQPYSPTIDNEPAITWIREGKQAEHLGDTFTNIQQYDEEDESTYDAGKSWRWTQSEDGTYGWTQISDSDAVAALKKAAEAQDTADGKRRIFVTQPTQEQAYDIGDLWVNATYSDGSVTYNNDILRANTAKQAGYPFSISHWGQASAYRDLYDQALQKAQAAADAAGDVQTAVDDFKTDIEETFQDGVITTSEASRLRTLIDTINTTVYNAKQTFNDVYNNSHLEGTTEKSNLLTAYNAFIADTDDDPNTITPRIVAIIEQLLAKVDNTQTPYQITKGDISSINQEYATFNDNYEDYIVALNAANLKITSQIANTAEASAVAKYAYLENLFSGKTTINGAVITTGMMVVGTENSATGEYQVNGGFSGVINDAELGDGMAIWYGGDKIDAETSSDHNDRIAGSLLRYDGSGYFGAKWVQDSKGDWNVEYGIRWDKDGVVTVDPATFWVGEEKIDLLLQVFNAIDSEPSDGVTDEVVMRVPFREVLIGSAYIGYDAANNSVYVYKQNQDGTREACNFYATGEVTAYGSSYEDESPEYARYVRDLRDVNYGGNVDPDSADTLLMWNGTTWAYINKNDVGLNEAQLEQYLTENEYAKKSDLITNVSWSAITGKPTTLSGYGITDAVVIKDGSFSSTTDPDANYPAVGYWPNVGSYFSMVHKRWGGQLKISNMELYIRGCNDAVFGDWTKVITESNYTSTLDTRYVKKSGDTMTSDLNIMKLSLGKGNEINSSDKLYLGYRDTPQGVNVCFNNAPFTYGSSLYTVWHAGNDGSGSGLDADLLDGVHNGDLVALTIRGVYTGAGGTQPPSYFADRGISVNMMSVPIQFSDVVYINGYNNAGYDVPYVNAIAFQKADMEHTNVYHASATWNGSSWNTWHTFIDSYNIKDYNAGSATKLQTPRSIWGQSFDGTANIIAPARMQYILFTGTDGSDVGYVGRGATSNNNVFLSAYSGNSLGIGANNSGTDIFINTSHNVGIGTSSPSRKLSVYGDMDASSIYVSDWFRSIGNNGWFSQTYGGGIYMEDSTWVRIYNNKSLYVTGTIFVDGYNNHGNNYGYIVINKLGDYFAAIGGNGAIDEIKFGKSGIDGAWVAGNINWNFEGNIVATGEVTAYGSSDIRLKTNIQPLRALDTVRKMNIVEYDWNEEALALRNSDIMHGYGLIAQELEQLIPEVVTHDMYGKGYMGIDYRNLVPFALSAIQQVDDEVTSLKKRVKELEDRLSKYEYV